MYKQIGIVGLGKMGFNLSLNLLEKGWEVVGFNRTEKVTKKLKAQSSKLKAPGKFLGVYSYRELVERLGRPRLVWLMVPHGAVDGILFDKRPHGDENFFRSNSSPQVQRRSVPFLKDARKDSSTLVESNTKSSLGENLGKQLSSKDSKSTKFSTPLKRAHSHPRTLPSQTILPAGTAVNSGSESTLDTGSFALTDLLEKGDILIDGGNSFYKDSIRRERVLIKKGIYYIDAGVSGGPKGAREGACLMVGGNKSIYNKLGQLWKDIAIEDGYGYFGKSGAGHFVKMVHNGIEYGIMQAIAEGFDILRQYSYKRCSICSKTSAASAGASKSDARSDPPNSGSPICAQTDAPSRLRKSFFTNSCNACAHFQLDLEKIAGVYNHGSVIESRLIGWIWGGFGKYGEDLGKVSGRAGASGEGEWTVKTAKELQVSAKVIEAALEARKKSQKKPNYQGKIISALRNMFGGHGVGTRNT